MPDEQRHLIKWVSYALQRVRPGFILVCAADAETARQMVKDGFDAWWDDAHDYLQPFDEDDLRRKEEDREQVHKDIAVKPVRYHESLRDVEFIYGSE